MKVHELRQALGHDKVWPAKSTPVSAEVVTAMLQEQRSGQAKAEMMLEFNRLYMTTTPAPTALQVIEWLLASEHLVIGPAAHQDNHEE